MALLGTQQFVTVVRDGKEVTEVRPLEAPEDLEAFVSGIKSLLDGASKFIAASDIEDPEAKAQALAEAAEAVTDEARKHAWFITSQYIQDADRSGKPLLDRNDMPYAFHKMSAMRERGDGDTFYPMTQGTFRMRETQRGATLAYDTPLNDGGKGRKAKGKGGKGKR